MLSALSYRDDIETSAYTLIYLCRSSLPWTHYAHGYGTYRARIRQVHCQKAAYNGRRLAAGIPVIFGDFVDYSRALAFDQLPDNGEWRSKFASGGRAIDEASAAFDTSVSLTTKTEVPVEGTPESSTHVDVQPSCPVVRGQVVLVQLLPSWCIESYRLRVGHEDSFIPDPALESDEWATDARAGIITEIAWNSKLQLYSVTVICLGIDGVTPRPDHSLSICSPTHPVDGISVTLQPAWPLPDTYCYTFKRPFQFFILPSQVPIPTTFAATDTDLLSNYFAPQQYNRTQYNNDLSSPDRDTRYDVRLRQSCTKLYARLSSLPSEPREISSVLSRAGCRAWFDECVRIVKRVELDDQFFGRWTTTGEDSQSSSSDSDDSYYAYDHSMWDARQREQHWTAPLPSDCDSIDVALHLSCLHVVDPDNDA